MPAVHLDRQDSADSAQESGSTSPPSTAGSKSTIRASKGTSGRKFGTNGKGHAGDAHNDASDEEDAHERGKSQLDESAALLGGKHGKDKVKVVPSGAANGKKKRYGATSGSSGDDDEALPPTSVALVEHKRAIRRTLTSPGMSILFFLLLLFTFLDLVLTLVLALNAGFDLNDAFFWAPHRGSGLLEVWVALLGSWAGAGAIFFVRRRRAICFPVSSDAYPLFSQFSSPVFLLFLTNALSLITILPIFLLTIISPPMRRAHYPFLALPLGLTAFTYLLCLLASFFVRRAHDKQAKHLMTMIARRQAERSSGSSPRRRQQEEEEMARVMVGLEGGTFSLRRIWAFVKSVMGFVGGLIGLLVMVVSHLLMFTLISPRF